jgi:hypothetical protein
MQDEAVICAANNAAWCDSLCRAHGLVGTTSAAAWIQPLEGPPYYPNVVTLSCADSVGQYAAIAALAPTLPASASVKDSFDRLDLAPIGFRPLFDAEWIWRDPAPAARPDRDSGGWTRIDTDGNLAFWEEAWAGGPSADGRVFRSPLLNDPRVVVMGARVGSRSVAGCVAYQSSTVVGLSNFFAPAEGRESYRAGAIAAVTALAPEKPIVGYESGEELASFIALGFRAVGRLTVWARP